MKKLAITTLLLLLCLVVKAQDKDIHASAEVQGITTTDGTVPFWLRANQFGSIPLPGTSGSFIGKIRKDYDSTKKFGWGASFEGRANFGRQSQFQLIKGFIKAHAGIFEIKAGRSKDIIGITDSTLSSGSFSISGNALGVPKAGISIPDYYSIPVFGKLIAIKGGFANGYIGDETIQYGKKPNGFKSYFWENYLYARIGKPDWRFKVEMGFNHEVLWGDEKDVFGHTYALSPLQTYWYAISGKTYNQSKVGNHLGSVDIALDYQFDAIYVMAYHQFIYDEGALGHLANIRDGLTGISITNNEHSTADVRWKKLVFEFLYTVNQAGYPNSKFTLSGAEDYYNNYEYLQGWSYNNLGLGTPFITPYYQAKDQSASIANQFFINNRVSVLNAATQITAFNWYYTAKVSFSQNYGTFKNGSEKYRGTGGSLTSPKSVVPFKKVNELSSFLEGIRPLKNGYNVGYDIGYDHGQLLYNSFGLILKASKTFL